jgi:hypothetical protein
MHRHRKTPQETPKGSGQPLTTVDATKVWSLPENMGRVYGVGVCKACLSQATGVGWDWRCVGPSRE